MLHVAGGEVEDSLSRESEGVVRHGVSVCMVHDMDSVAQQKQHNTQFRCRRFDMLSRFLLLKGRLAVVVCSNVGAGADCHSSLATNGIEFHRDE